jgi:hypothetical protein
MLYNILFEINKYKKETGENLPRTPDLLKKYIDKKAQNNLPYFVHYSNLNILSLNPNNTYGTPLGIYAYPLISNVSENFATERKYAHIFTLKMDLMF